LSDAQVRQVLAKKLKQEAVKSPAPETETELNDDTWNRITTTFYGMEQGASTALKRIVLTFSSGKTTSGNWPAVVDRLSDGKGTGHLLFTILIGLVLIACGVLVERLFLRFTEDLRQQLLTSVPLGRLQRFGLFVSRLVLDALGVAVYMLTTFALFVLIYDRGSAAHSIVSIAVIVSYYFKIIMLAAKVVLSPASPALRLLPLQDDDAAFLYRWLFRITLIAVLFAGPSVIFRDMGRSEALFMVFYSAAGIGIIVSFVLMIWQIRERIATAICQDASEGVCVENTVRARFARRWHVFGTLYVTGAGAYWLLNLWTGGGGEIVKLIASLFLIPIFIGLDQWGLSLLKIASGELPETIDLSGDDAPEIGEQHQADSKMNIKHYVPIIKRSYRALLVIFLFFLVLRLWGIDLAIGRFFTSRVLQIVIILMLGFFVWEFTKARIDRKLKEEMPEEAEEAEEGGAGGSRSATLLVLFRKFVLTVMVVIGSLIVLSSMGINIGPLIAGAGVIGLAIGFGAQTLVRDIISGIFFLVDDAFRVGDYVETAGVKGMVEHISLRSMKLRNPRGMVITIPFGDMGTITNFSRDYIVTKLDFRVRYDTDVDKVRKIIKKINQTLEKDEEIGPVLLDKIKSQGVRELDDSAMIMRVKFKTIPGQQFVVRRHVFQLIQEGFKKAGIEFAHRNVTVYMPPEITRAGSDGGGAQGEGEGKPSIPDQKILEAGAAAAIAATQADEGKEKMKKSR
jgi:hypothetical protein